MAKQRRPKPFSTLDLEQSFQADAAEIIAARSKGRILHKAKSISSSGTIVEAAVRSILAKRLPRSYDVGEGYIVDKNLVASPQYDVILADDLHSAVLFRDHNGSEWFTYESVYAIGEVKSGYHPVTSPMTGTKVPPINAFVESLKMLRTSLMRSELFAPEWNSLRERIKADPNCPQAKMKIPPDNYLLSFMLFVDSHKMQKQDLLDLYKNTAPEDLPTVVCFLDRGLILCAGATDAGMELTLTPGYTPVFSLSATHQWALHAFGQPEYEAGANLATLCFLLNRHLSVTRLEKPDIREYQKKMLQSRLVLDLK